MQSATGKATTSALIIGALVIVAIFMFAFSRTKQTPRTEPDKKDPVETLTPEQWPCEEPHCKG